MACADYRNEFLVSKFIYHDITTEFPQPIYLYKAWNKISFQTFDALSTPQTTHLKKHHTVGELQS